MSCPSMPSLAGASRLCLTLLDLHRFDEVPLWLLLQDSPQAPIPMLRLCEGNVPLFPLEYEGIRLNENLFWLFGLFPSRAELH